MTMTYFQSEVNRNKSADSRGSDSLLVLNLWKETSVLSLFRPSFWPGSALTQLRLPATGLSLTFPPFWLLQISACFLSHSLFPFDTFVLNRYFSMKLSTRPALFLLLILMFLTGRKLVPTILRFSPLLSHSCCCLWHKAAGVAIFWKLGTFFEGQHVVRHLQNKTPKGPLKDKFLFLIATQT